MKIDWKTPVPIDCIRRIPFLSKDASVSFFYDGIHDGYLHYTLREADSQEERKLAAYLMIDKDNESLWKALEEATRTAVKNAELSLCGAFSFEIAGVNDLETSAFFDFENFAQWIARQGASLGLQESRIFPYGGMSCFLRKNSALDWGKVSFSSPIHFIEQEKMNDRDFWKRVLGRVKIQEKISEVLFYDLTPGKLLLGQIQEETLKTILEKIKISQAVRIHQFNFESNTKAIL